VSVGGRIPDDYELILDRIEACLRRISERRTAHALVRGTGALPLVALPVVGKRCVRPAKRGKGCRRLPVPDLTRPWPRADTSRRFAPARAG
jgi:hypothetical protein